MSAPAATDSLANTEFTIGTANGLDRLTTTIRMMVYYGYMRLICIEICVLSSLLIAIILRWKISVIVEILLIRLRSSIFIIFFVQDWTIKKILFFVLNIQFAIKNSSNNLRSKHTQTNFSFVILKTSSKPQSKTGANLFHINRSSAPFIFCILIYCGRK